MITEASGTSEPYEQDYRKLGEELGLGLEPGFRDTKPAQLQAETPRRPAVSTDSVRNKATGIQAIVGLLSTVLAVTGSTGLERIGIFAIAVASITVIEYALCRR